MNEFHEFLTDATTFIVGSEKNAGKTTFLNYALAKLRQKGVSPAFLTIGVDGEQRDQVFGNPKPQIYSEVGDFFVTTESMLENSDGLFEIHEVFPARTALGRLVLAKTLRGGHIELIGPEDNSQLSEIVSCLRSSQNVNTILVDGAVNRITQVSAGQQAGFVYVVKVTQRNLNSVIERMRILSLVNGFSPAINGRSQSSRTLKHPHTNGLGTDSALKTGIDAQLKSYIFRGALTKNKLAQIPKHCKTLILEDFTKIFLSFSEISVLCQKMDIQFETIYQFHGFVVNLYDVTRNEFVKQLEKYNITEHVMFNPYQA